MKRDLEAAGIPVVDSRGYRVDFHALRYTFASLLAQAGVSEGMRVKLARHSDWRQTDRYTDAHSLPLFSEMEKLGSLIPSPRELLLPLYLPRRMAKIPKTGRLLARFGNLPKFLGKAKNRAKSRFPLGKN